MESLVLKFLNSALSKHRCIGVAMLRIALGLVTTVYFALHIRQRNLLWGPNGVLPTIDASRMMSSGHAWSLYQIFPSAAGAEALYWTSLAVAAAFTLGYRANILKWPFLILTWSTYQRNWLAIDGGENLLVLLMVYLLFADLSALSLNSSQVSPSYNTKDAHWISAMLHNAAVTACLAQVAMLYFVSAFFKVHSKVWVNGTAIYYILRTDSFSLPGVTEHLVRSATFVTGATYATILFELAYPWLVWQHRFRYLITVGAVFLHFGIAVLMGLPWFSLTMISVHVLLFRDSEYEQLAAWLGRQSFLTRSIRYVGVGSEPATATHRASTYRVQ